MHNLLYLFSLIVGIESIWDKHYLTWSLENGTNNGSIRDAIAMWNIKPLEFARVEPGKGDIKIYFAPLKSYILGQAYPPPHGDIYINEKASPTEVFYIVQHEIGHALGLKHFGNSIMQSIFTEANVSEQEIVRIRQIYGCSFNSATLLNYDTYLMFQGSYYARFGVNSKLISSDKLWIPFVTHVDAMYRKPFSSNYVLISNDKYYELTFDLKFAGQGPLKQLFPNVTYVDTVLPFPNGTLYVIENLNIYIGDYKMDLRHVFKPRVPRVPIRGAFFDKNGQISLLDDQFRYIYDSNFRFIKRRPLSEMKIHC